MPGQPQALGRLHQAVGDSQIRHRRKFNGSVFQARVLIANGAGGHHQVAGLNVHVNTATGAGTQKGVCTALVQFLHSDSCGWSTDAGGAGSDLLAQQRAGPHVVFPVAGHLMGVVQKRGDGGNPAGIAGEDAIAANVSGLAADMKLLFHGLHGKRLQSVSFYPLYQTAGRFSTGVPNCGFISRFSEQPCPCVAASPAGTAHLIQFTLQLVWSPVPCADAERQGKCRAASSFKRSFRCPQCSRPSDRHCSGQPCSRRRYRPPDRYATSERQRRPCH